MVGRAKRSRPDQATGGVQHASHAVNLGGLQCFLEGQRRQNRGHALGQHGLAGSGRTNHEQVVPARCGNLDGTFGRLLSAYVAKVDGEILRRLQQRPGVNLDWLDPIAGVQQLHHLDQRMHWINVDTLHQGSLARVDLGNNQLADVVAARHHGYRQRATDAAQASIQRKLAHK